MTRPPKTLRPLSFDTQFTKHAEGACLSKMGDTWVLVTASIEEKVPRFLEGQKQGWITAEYGMLPRATHSRNRREAQTGRPSGRTQEIQRLIGRSLRAAVDLSKLGERTITFDCDVLQADGGTRVTAINGAAVALNLAISHLQDKGLLKASPVTAQVGAISMGLKEGEIYADLDYALDSTVDVDCNIVMLSNGGLVEIQGTAERGTMTPDELRLMVDGAQEALDGVFSAQEAAFKATRA